MTEKKETDNLVKKKKLLVFLYKLLDVVIFTIFFKKFHYFIFLLITYCLSGVDVMNEVDANSDPWNLLEE